MLSFIYQLPLTGNPNPHLSLSLSTAASIYARRGQLLPILASRGAGNTPKVSLADMTHMKSDTITMNLEQARNVILAAFNVITPNRREETAEEKKQHREERDLKEVHGQVSPNRVSHPVIFGRSAVCPMGDVSALCSGTRNPWASLNWWHRRSHPSEPCSSICIVSRSAPYTTRNSLNKSPTPLSPLPGPAGIIETIRHPHGIGPEKPVIVVPVTTSFITTHIQTVTTQCRHKQPTGVCTKVPAMAPSECITPLCHSFTLILDIVAFPYTISLLFLSLFGLSQAMRALPCGGGHLC